jgi:Flp pilus assembly protein protease CpaA
LIFLTGVAGLLLAFVFIGARMTGLRKHVPKEDRRIPYGVAIAAGAILTAVWSGWRTIFPAFNL